MIVAAGPVARTRYAELSPGERSALLFLRAVLEHVRGDAAQAEWCLWMAIRIACGQPTFLT